MRGEAKTCCTLCILSGCGSHFGHFQSNSSNSPCTSRGEEGAAALWLLSDGQHKDGSVRKHHKASQQNFPDLHFPLKSGR